MAVAYFKIDLEFELHNDDDPDIDPVSKSYTPGWNDNICLSYLRDDYPAPYPINLDKEDLVDGVFDVEVSENMIRVKCSGIFKGKVEPSLLDYALEGKGKWYFGGIMALYGKLGKVFSNGALKFDPSKIKKNPSTYEYQKSWEVSIKRKEGPEIEVLIGKTKSSLSSK